MTEYFGLEILVYFFIVVVIALAYQLDRSSKHAIDHIDRLQERVYELEERVGIRNTWDYDPIGFVRDNDDNTHI